MGFFGQYGRLLLVLIKLKSWRFLFMLIVIAALFSNIYLYDIVDSWMQQRGEKNLVQVGPAEFGDRNIIVGFVPEKLRELNKLKEMIERMTGFDFSSSIEGCDSEEICNEMYFRNLLGRRSGMLSHFVHFGKYRGGASHLICQMSIGSEMHCPFMAYLVRTSQTFFNGTVHEFHSTSVFRLMSKIQLFDEIVGGEMTICKKDANFPVVFPKTIMAQVICVLITLVFYLFVSTMTCIYELKQHGYLQILFRKGLGVLAYWAAIWTITLFEMALFAGVITTAYLVQCISFFSSTQLVDTFVGALLQFCLVAATVLLFSIVTKQLALSGAYCCTYLIIVVAIVLANRMYLAEGPIFVRYILLIMPAGHLAEQLFTGLTNISDNKVDSLMMHVSGGFLALTILFTVYFDFVFKSGNGWRLPCTFYFTSGFWSRPKKQPQEDDKEASAMFEAAQNWWRVLVATKGIKKSFASCMTKNEDALSNFSTKFYQDQITAVVGHNGSGKSILMQILSGERNATAGLATVDKVPITDSLTRYHMCSSIGYCPQHDGLVDRLSVSDTIKLAVLSTGKSWDREENKVRHILSSLGIESKIEESIQNLSYSEKRKVSVTIALIGQPRVVLLDDPSRDMDYISKRRLWQLLHEFKIGHSVIVSTLFINEAEAVADRIVFLSGGRVLCAGSPFFFKRAFDCRFIIQIASKTEFHVPYIIRKITSKFNSVRVRSFSNADVEFEVSVMDDSILSPVTAEIEKLAKLIDEYGIVHHSLDDVFSKLKSIPPKEVDRHFEMGTIGYVADDVDRIKALMKKKPVDPPDTPGKVKRMPSLLRTIFAMLVSSVLQTFRSKVRIVTRIAMPLFLVALIALGAFLERGKKNDNISLWVNLSDTSQVEESTRRGICMYPLSENVANHFDALNKKDCSSMLTSDALSENVVPMELLIEKYPRGNLQAALLAPKNLKKSKTCKNSKVVCPIIFGNDFCPDRKPIPTYTKNHTISVGAYIPTSNYTPTYFVATAIKVYGHLLNVMIKKIYKDSSMDTKMLIVVEGIQDMRGTFFQFYGLFVLVTFISVVPVIFLDDVMTKRAACGTN
ncbi:hypothetical protein BOX15_Mlig014614g1 [Macrostomum lignano]|uniref:ABC transporter domain-containing protein n=1 Tax=Macrostomum lignano TaxID=282301 RepID=A0A267EZ63_9PLAT|nr:hypothetical protein BOX15_Mlig014614g1 [Macrostomum lignano]